MSSAERLAPLPSPPAPGATGPVGEAASLPGRRYGEDRLHLLVRDPRRVLAIWELSPGTASAVAARAGSLGAPVRYRVRVEREREPGEGLAPEIVAEADLPDALGGEGWYLAIPPRAGRCRAVLGLDWPGGFEALLTSRWVATPPEGPCDELGAWPLAEGGDAWVAREWRHARSPLAHGLAPSSAARYLPPREEA